MGRLYSSTSRRNMVGCDGTAGQNFPLSSPTQQPLHLPAQAVTPRSPDPSRPYQLADHAVSAPEITSRDGGMVPLPAPFCPSPYPPWPHQQPPNIVINQHYYMAPVPSSGSVEMGTGKKRLPVNAPQCTGQLHLGSFVNLATDLLPVNIPRLFDDGRTSYHTPGPTLLNQGAALYDQLSSTFDNLMTAIDQDHYEGIEANWCAYDASTTMLAASHDASQRKGTRDHSKSSTTGMVASLMSKNYFAKVHLYANSKLPLNLPPMKLYLASYQLLSLAAKYSDRAYLQPQGAERFAHIGADWRAGTKAMVIKSVPMDDANIIVFAIRGTSNFMDWAVNLNMAPTSPAGFLDDPGNFCHAGFLSVARKMIRPVAAHLRQFLEEDPSRASYSLLITGHSAGGAVASLLYAHMVASSAQAASELNLLTGCFRRIHCITFGAPPVSLLPLKKPDRKELAKSLFFSFVNEGDPVVRADREYVKSLIGLFSTSVPNSEVPMPVTKFSTNASKLAAHKGLSGSSGSLESSKSSKSLLRRVVQETHGSHRSYGSDVGRGATWLKPVWKVPPSTLSNAGRIVVLRSGNPRLRPDGRRTVGEWLRQGVVAQFTSDEQLRSVVWGDPLCHVMKLYAGRIEILAVASVMVDA